MFRMLRSRKGQGTTEYIVILAIAVFIAVTIFWSKLKGPLTGKVNEITTKLAPTS